MTTSPCNKYLVVADCLSNIVIWENAINTWKKYCKLPKYECVPTSIGVQPNTLLLIVTYSDQKVRKFVNLIIFGFLTSFFLGSRI